MDLTFRRLTPQSLRPAAAPTRQPPMPEASANLDVVADGNGNATLNIGPRYTPADAGKEILHGPDQRSRCNAVERNVCESATGDHAVGITAAALFTLSAGTSATGVATIQGDAKPRASVDFGSVQIIYSRRY